MAWTSLSFAYGSVLTSTKMTQMYDNFSAMATKASGSPEVQASTITEPTQAQMEAATDTTLGVSPRAMNWHPGMTKTWGYVTVSGGIPTLQVSWNVTSITDNGVGDLTVTIATDFSSANYPAECTVRDDGSSHFPYALEAGSNYYTKAAGTVRFQCYSPITAGLLDPGSWSFSMKGDQ